TNSVYYCYYENEAFWKADGSKICTIDELPFHPSDASVVYQATPELGKAWIFDLAIDQDKPVVAYTRYPNDTLHHYYYAIYEKGQWVHHKIIESGRWFPHTQPNTEEREVNYSGGLTFDPAKPSVLYLSHQVNGRFEISKAQKKKGGKNGNLHPSHRIRATTMFVRLFLAIVQKIRKMYWYGCKIVRISIIPITIVPSYIRSLNKGGSEERSPYALLFPKVILIQKHT